MKIIHIVLGKANPNRMNGVNKVVHELASAQHAAGQKVEVWGITADTSAPLAPRGFRTRLFKARKLPFSCDVKLIRELKGEPQPLVVHFHGGFIPAFPRIAGALTKERIPYFITAHGAYNRLAMRKSKWKKGLYFRIAERRFLRNAKAVHCIGASELVSLKELLPEAKTVLIPNGHHMPEPKKVDIPSEVVKEPVFGFCGRLRAHTKGLDILLQGFALYAQKSQGSLLIIGDGEDRNKLEKMVAALKLESRVQWLGARYGAEKDEILTKMDVFLHPSRNEGMPGAVLEAAAIGIPVIVSEETNLANWVRTEEAGIALSHNEPEALAQALTKAGTARQQGELARWSINARRMVQTVFSWHRIAGLHLEMYQS